jgi:hypothetical protein
MRGRRLPLGELPCHDRRFSHSSKKNRKKGAYSGPEDIAVMTTAFDQILLELKLTDRRDPIITMIAKLVIEIVRNGERNPERVRKQVLDRHQTG